MPYLDYYRDERIAFPQWNIKAVAYEDAVALTHKLCKFAGLPEIPVSPISPKSRYSGLFYGSSLYSTYARIEYHENRSTSLLTVVHEVAHYWDYHLRREQVKLVKSKIADDFKRMVAIHKIGKKHAHSRFHWHLMELLMGLVTTFKDVSPIFARSQPMELDFDPEFAHQIASIRKDYSLKLAEKNELTKLFKDLAAYRESLTADLQSASMAA
jgi:hypothetical protein